VINLKILPNPKRFCEILTPIFERQYFTMYDRKEFEVKWAIS